jgi:hypothetical protein
MIWMLFSFCWVSPQLLNFIVHKIQTPGNHPQERIQSVFVHRDRQVMNKPTIYIGKYCYSVINYKIFWWEKTFMLWWINFKKINIVMSIQIPPTTQRCIKSFHY